MNQADWPVAELDAVRRMRVLAAATGAMFDDEYIDAPFDTVWRTLADVETSLPLIVADIRSFRVLERPGEDRLVAAARGYLGQRARFDVLLQPGWCVMRSRFVIGGFAAVPEGAGTRFAACGGLRAPGAGSVARLLSALGLAKPAGRRMIGRLAERCAAVPPG